MIRRPWRRPPAAGSDPDDRAAAADDPEAVRTVAQDRLAEALRQWRAAFGAAHVHDAAAALDRYARTTLPHGNRALAVVRPGGLDDVVAAVRIANACGVPLYPISRGRNWGYGDACPPTPGQVILDLGRMDRILEVNEELAYAVIEPGVSQGRLAGHLRDIGAALWLDCTGAGPDASVVGNILERGFGHTPYGNRVQFVSGLEVVLGDGRVLRTGFGHYDCATAERVYPYGPGPILDGLFTQSNMGIVTKVGVWLLPAPEAFTQFICLVHDGEDLGPVVDAVRRLRLQGAVHSVVHIGNDMRLISSSRTYPLDRAGGAVPLPAALREALRRELGVGAWLVSGGLYGSRGQVAAARGLVKAALKGPRRKLIFLSPERLDRAARLARLARPARLAGALTARLGRARDLVSLHCGVPTGQFLSGAYWRRRGGLPDGFPAEADPAQDGCGLLWLAPVLPQTGESVRDLLGIVEPIYAAHRFDLLMTLATINERALDAVLTIAFDRDDPAETDRADACYRTLFEAVCAAGYVPYRVGAQSMADITARGSPVHRDVVAAIKRTLDPGGVVAPGRYDPAAFRSDHPASGAAP